MKALIPKLLNLIQLPLVVKLLFFFITFVAILLSFFTRSTLFVKARFLYISFIIILPIVSGAIIIILNKKKKYELLNKSYSLILLILLAFALINTLRIQYTFYNNKSFVLNSSPEELEVVGQKFIVGYKDFEEVKKLVELKAIGGLYITKRNIEGKTRAEVKSEIDTLQKIQKENGLPPLIVTADNEGGFISALHLPGITSDLPMLSSFVVNEDKLDRDTYEKIQDFARTQAEDLKSIGVNVNFAPVVDLKYKDLQSDNSASRIGDRSIASNPNLVSEVAMIYAQSLLHYGIVPTYKHFPGLGRQVKDTHVSSKSEIIVSYEDLEKTDLIPYIQLTQDNNTYSFIMLSHATIPAIDGENPVSVSSKAINDTLRNKLGFKGMTITDDFGMASILYSKDGIGDSTIKSINAGVDYILISYDYEIYYDAMAKLLVSYKNGGINPQVIAEHNARVNELNNFYLNSGNLTLE